MNCCKSSFQKVSNSIVFFQLFLFSFLLVLGNQAFSQLSGTYTIGGTSPSYASISSAVSALNTSGVNGSVKFHIRQGTYTERISIGSITGASATNTITFRSDPVNTTAVTIQYTNSSTSNNYVFQLNGTKYVSFIDLKIKAAGSTYSTAFELKGINDYITIDSCALEMNSTITGSTIYRSGIYELVGSANRTSNFTLSNSTIKGGSYGIYSQGYSSGIWFQKDWKINKNKIEDFYYAGIYLYNYFDTVQVEGNEIIQRSSATGSSYGIYTYRNYKTNIESNKVVMTSSSCFGMYLLNQYGLSTKRQRVANNMVAMTNAVASGTRYGIYFNGSNYTDVVFNSIFQANGSGYSLYGRFGTGNTYKNNAISNVSTSTSAYAMFYQGTSTRSHNCVWAPNSTTSNLVLGTGSKNKNPLFTSNTNLHSSSIDLNNSGTPISGITKDIDGQLRSTTVPDMGADEFTPPANDGGVSEIENRTVCAGSNSIKVRLRNFGSSSLTSATINWSVKVNSGSPVSQTSYSFSGNVASGKDTVISIGTYSMVSTSSYTIRAWSTSPNGSTDGNASNDSTTKTYTTSLSGIYTVGGSSPDYSTIQAAATALKNKGVCGPVTFRIRSGSYNEAVTVDSGKGMSAINTVTFTKDPTTTGNVFWYRSGRPITFRNTQHVIVKDLVIETKSFSNAIYFQNHNSDITIKNNTLRGYNSNSSAVSYAVIYGPNGSSSQTHRIVIDSNKFRKGSAMVYLSGASTTLALRERGNKIRYNTYDSSGYYGIYLQNQDSAEVVGNTIKDSHNAGTQYGILVSGVYNFNIERNKFFLNLRTNSWGIYLTGGGGTSGGHSIVVNNYVNQSKGQYGIYSASCAYTDYYYNTVRLQGTNAASYAAYFNYGNTYLKNNNFVNEAAGYVIFTRLGTYFPLSDNNNLYTTSKTLFAYANGYRTSFALWKSSTSKDANSVSVDPYWQSAAGPEPNNTALNGAGTSITGISKDIKGNTRSSSPDMGCVEFAPSTNDAGISEIIDESVCPGSSSVKVRLRNFGNNTLTQARVQWNVKTNSGSAVAQTAYSWTGSLASYTDTIISIGNYTFVGSNNYVITAYTDRANNTTDLVKTNDTSVSNTLSPRMKGVYTVGGTSPNYSNLNAALTALQSKGVCGPVTLNIRSGSYNGRSNFNAILGASAVNTITVQTDPATSGQADLYYSGYPFYFSGAGYITVKNIKVRTTGSSSVVYFGGSNHHVTFDNDSLIGSTINTTSAGYSILYDITSTNAIQKNLVVKNSVVLNGSYGAYLYGNATTGVNSQNGIEISNCKFLNQYYMGVYGYYCPEIKVKNNTITNRNIYTSAYGAYVQYCDSSEISGNNISIGKGYSGIYAAYCYGNSSKEGMRIHNNFVQYTDTNNTNTQYGIYNYWNTYSVVAFNSVNIPSGSASSSGIYSRFGNNQKILNNSFVNEGNGYAQYLLSASAVVQLDYNNLYSKGNNLGYYNGNRTNLANWKTGTGTGKANNSISVDPLYVSYLDLHAQNNAIDGMATPVSGITDDIDGDSRNSTSPDIGADEFTIFARDAGITSVNASSVCIGSQSIKVKLRNFGSSALTSTSIQWRVSVNGGTPVSQAAFSFSGSLASGKDSSISIGSYTFSKGNSYVVEANTSGFNSSTDQNTSNDSSSSISLVPSMSGLYTVGSGAGDDWSTIDSAISALETVGVCAPVTIYVKSGSYLERITFNSIPGANSANQVTILGDTTGTGADWYSTGVTLALYEVQYVNFKNLKIRTTGLSNAVRFYTNNSYINFEKNILEGRNINSTSTNYAVVHNDNSTIRQQHHISFIKNTVSSGSVSFYWYGRSSGVNSEKGNRFIGNDLKDAYYMGLYIYGQDSSKIENNTINTKSIYTNCSGIYATLMSNYQITANTINLRKGGTGLYLSSASGTTSDSTEVVNNFITVGGTAVSYGIQSISNNYVRFLHNSIRLYNTQSSSYCFYHNNGLGVEVKNNSMYNSGNGRVIRISNRNYYLGNYNNLKTNGSVFGYYAGNRSTFALWKSSTLDDANSVSVNPNYKDTFDLHTTSATLNNAGTPVGVTVDFDGDSRSTSTPDIGADEFNSIPRDLGLLSIIKGTCEGTQNVEIRIKNEGTSTITKTRIKWSVATNGGSPVAQNDFVLNANLVSLKDSVVSLGNVTFSRGSYYDILVYVDSVNTGLDQNNSNDTLKQDSSYAAMNGVYTVGGTTPDFNTVSSAVNAVKSRGVCGPVRIFLRSGTYIDRILIQDSIRGASSVNSVTFETDTASTVQSVIRNSNAPIQLQNVSFIRINNLKISTTGARNVIYCSNSNDIRITDNDLTGYISNSTSVAYSVIRFNKSGTGADDFLVKGNTIKNGSSGLYIDGNGRTSNTEIRENDIIDFTNFGIYTYRADSIVIAKNILKNKRSSTSFISALYQGYSIGFKIYDNKIDFNGTYVGNSNRTGISLVGSDGLSVKRAEIYNNFIAIGGFSTNVNGMEIVQSDYINVDHNSVNIYSTGNTSKAIKTQSSTNNYYRNNSFVNNGGGYSFYTNNQPSISNYNNLYTSGTVLAYYSGNRSNLASWRSATSRDQQSVSVKPNYFTSSNLHTSAVGLNSKGININYISTDIDGDSRSSVRDIGADEFSPIARDVALTNQIGILCPGSNPVQVEMRNVGSTTITSVKINWYISTNGGAFIAQSKAKFSGSISSGNTRILTVGNFTFLDGNFYSIQAIVDSVNNQLDGNVVNDTTVKSNLSPALSGVYSVGSGGDFASIAAADSALDQRGVCGPVVLELNQGTYNEAITMGSYSGVSAVNTIIIRPDSSNTAPVYWTNSSIALRLIDATYITIQGLNISTSGSSNVIYMNGNVRSILFKDNVITGSSTTNSSFAYASVRYLEAATKKLQNVTFDNNTFSKGTYGIYLGGTSLNRTSKLLVKNNSFTNYRYAGISTNYCDSITIENNSFKNSIAGGYYGIRLLYSNQFSVQKNEIDNTTRTGTSAIYVGWSNGTSASRGIIANNFFASTANNFIKGVELRNNTYTNFYFNSVNLLGSGSSTNSNALYCSNGSNNNYYNNNVVNGAGGYAIYVTGTNEYTTANNNNYYSSSSTRLGYYKGSSYGSLTAWRSGSSRDMQSVSGNPFFKSAGDLHALGIVTNNVGTTLTGFATDIDGESRGSSPDIGADEYTASPNDAGLDSISKSLFCLGANNVYVQLTNYGTDTLKSATINWKVTEMPGNINSQTPFSWTGSLLTGQSALVNIGSFSLSMDTSYQVSAYTSSPNASTDGYIGNDSTQNTGREAAMSGTYVVAQSGPRDYSSVISAANDLNLRGVCGPVNIKVKSGTYSGSIKLKTIDGVSSTNMVVIESDTSNSSPAILSASSYTLTIESSDYITVRGFKIESSRYAAVYLKGPNNYITVESNVIQNNSTVNYYNYYYNSGVVVYNTTNQPNTHIKLLKNTITGGQYGIYNYSYTTSNKGVIDGNHISKFRNTGIYVRNDYDLNISNNSVFDSTFSYGSNGIYTLNCAVDLIANKVVVHSYSGGNAVHIQNSRDTSQARKKIVNNAISFIQKQNGSSNNWGMYLYFCDYQDVYYNSINMDGANNPNSRAFMVHSGTSATLRNNSFVNNNGGYALFASTATQITSSDYNNLFTSGNNMAYRSGTNYSNLTGWRTSTSMDANSTSANANYMSAYNMAPNHIALDGNATTLSSVPTDVDGVVRGSSPDIGAYQFKTRKDDAGAVTLVTKQLCNGSQSVVLAVKNFGGDTLKSARVNWQISRNGGAFVSQPIYNWNGVMPPGEVDSNVVVGTFNFIGGNYQLRAYTSIPNTKTDELLSNDTLLDNLFIKLNGTYTLGDTSSDFKTWNAFANAINAAGVCGPVTIKAKPNTYYEHIVLDEVVGLNLTDNLTITSDTGKGLAMLTDSITPLALNNMKFVTIEHIELKATGNEAALRMDGYNHHINIDSNKIVGPVSYSNLGSESAIYVNSNSQTSNWNLSFVGNKIENGASGIYFSGSSISNPQHQMKIVGNDLSNFYSNGIYAYAVDSLDISLNLLSSTAGASSKAISLTYSDKFSIQRNRIAINSSSAGSGIVVNRSNGISSGYSHIVNNFIQVAGGNGMDITYSSYINSFYNSVNISPNKVSSTAGNAIRTFGVSSIDFSNNSLANFANGYVFDRTGGFTSNYNNIYTTGLLVSRNNVQDLADWRTASSQDANSVSADPIYLSETDLHANQTLMDSSANVLGSFTIDIDGQNRDATNPDMGADEFTLIKNVGIVEVTLPETFRARKWTSTAFSNSQSIEVVVRNFGPDVKDIPVEYQFNGSTVQDTIRGTLSAGKLDTFKFTTTVNMDTVGTHLLRVFTAMPNDQFIQNDTLDITIVTLENAKYKLPFVEGFENVKDTAIFENYLGMWDLEEWDFVTNGGRLQTKSGKKVSGSQAISLDRTPNGPIKKNELILNLNLSRYDLKDSVFLDFDFIDHRDERHAGDSVWVRGSDTSAWIGVYDLWRNRRTNRVKEVRNIEITPLLVASNQVFTESFQVKFGQEDNQRLPGDGRTFDNIVLRALLPYDLTIKDAVVEYRQVPKEMANNRYHATVGNQGYLTADSVQFRVDVSGAVNFSQIDSLMKDQDTLMTTTDSMNTNVAGTYTAYMSATFNGIDKCWENDSMDINFSLTDTVLARDDNVVDSTFGFVGSTGKMGTVLEVFRTDTITSVSFYLNFPTIGDTLKAEIFEIVNDTVGTKLLNTTTQVVNSNASAWYNLPIKCMEVLKPGKYLVSVEQSSTNYMTLGVTKSNYIKGVSWINAANNWSVFEDSLSGYLFNIHANFGNYDLPFISAPNAMCLNDKPVVLKSNRIGGKFLGNGVVNDSIFDPAISGFGTHKIQFGIALPNGCFDSSGVSILVDSLPKVNLPHMGSYCENSGKFNLTGGSPIGGTYFGNGISNNTFDPANGKYGSDTIFYAYSKPISGCADTAFNQISVKPKPTVVFGSVPDFCINDSIFTLTNSTPPGGTYGGTGVNDSLFNPSIAGLGNHNLSYRFNDLVTLCSDTGYKLITVNDTPKNNLGADTALCPNQTLSLSAIALGKWLWNTGDTTEHLKVSTGGEYWLLTTNQFGCTNRDTINVTLDAVCIGIDQDLVSNSIINYYPNPNNGRFTLSLNAEFGGRVELVIRNMQGQIVSTFLWNKTGADMIQEIDLSEQSSGVYFLDLVTAYGRATHRITINR